MDTRQRLPVKRDYARHGRFAPAAGRQQPDDQTREQQLHVSRLSWSRNKRAAAKSGDYRPQTPSVFSGLSTWKNAMAGCRHSHLIHPAISDAAHHGKSPEVDVRVDELH